MPAKHSWPAAGLLFRRLQLRQRLALYLALVALVSVGLVGWMTYTRAVARVTEEFGGKLAAVAAGAAATVDWRQLAALRESDDMESTAYRTAREHLLRARKAHPDIRFRYLYAMAPAGKPGLWRYLADTESQSSDDFSALGDTEKLPLDDVLSVAFETNRPASDDEVIDYPGWGPLLSAAAPVRDDRGKPVAVVGVDAPSFALTELRQELFRSALIAALAGVLLAIALSTAISWSLTRPLYQIMDAAESVGAGDLSRRLALPPGDEYGRVAEAFNAMTDGLRQRDLYKQQFERYVSRQIADKILREPERDFWHGERRKVTVLFCDIRGFTSVAETLPPEEVMALLNEYLTMIVDVVFAHGGTLDKFIGDAVMAVFGAPVSQGHDELYAVRAALAMREGVDKLCGRWLEEAKPFLEIGVGVNTGEVIVGNIGSVQRVEYAAIGDHVNVAARLEELNKEYGTTILISEHTYAAVQDLVTCRRVAVANVRGRTQPLEIYELLGLRDAA